MSEPILSPDEIKDLMNQPADPQGTGGYYQGEAKPFDLFGAAVQKDEKVQLLTQLHTNVLPSLSNVLSKTCDAELVMELGKHEMGNGAEYAKTLSSDKTLIVTWLDSRVGIEGFFAIDRTTFFALFGLLYGSRRPYDRSGALTGLEANAMDRVMNPLADVFTMAWKRSGGWNFELKEIADEQDKMAVFHTWNFECIRATFNIKAGEEDLGQIVVLYPRDVMKGMEVKEEAKEEENSSGGDHYWIEAVTYCIQEKKIPLNAHLGTLHLSLKDVLSLKEGEVYDLNVPARGHLLFINGKPFFRTAIGTVEGFRAVQVTGHEQGVIDG